jgi:hypothetical protein
MDHIREKLVELLDEAENQYLEAVSGAESSEERYAIVKGAYGFYADHLLTNGVTVQEWIPVSERLPEDGVQVLACTKHGKAFSAHCERGKFRASGSVTVTHWMPLPQPPKGE